MQRCGACDAKSDCDQVLAGETAPDVDALGFCANIDDLKVLRDAR
jgi:hypothetical protein